MKDSITFFLKRPLQLPIVLLTKWIPYFRFLYETTDYQNYVTFEFWFKQKVLNLGGNKNAYWPVHWTSEVSEPHKIIVGIDSAPGINGGAYITGIGGLIIGDYCLFAKNVIIVTANHDLYDSRIRTPEPVNIGNYCWLGAGVKIMPGVSIGNYTIVAAGAVVTKSFPEGYCVLGGVPAKIIKYLDKAQCNHYTLDKKYCGYIRKDKLDIYRKTKYKKYQ